MKLLNGARDWKVSADDGSSCRKSNFVPLVDDDPYPSQLFSASLAVHVTTRHAILVNVPSV